MEKLMLLGDEALAQGALDAGISGFYGYPGTPSTEIIEYVQRSKQAEAGKIHRILRHGFRFHGHQHLLRSV